MISDPHQPAGSAAEADILGWTAPASVGDYAVIGDLHTAAMVSRNASIDWLCMPRFDAPACFAAMLGGEHNGHWQLSPSQPVLGSSRRYLPGTLILETRFDTDSGSAVVLDFMPPSNGLADLVRIVRGVCGTVDFSMALRIRADYGRTVPWVSHI